MRIDRRLSTFALGALALGTIALPVTAQTTRPDPQPAYKVVPIEVTDETPSPAPGGVNDAAPIDPADRANIARAEEWFTRLQNGDVDRTQLTPAFGEIFTSAIVAQTSSRLKPFGDPTSFVPGGKVARDGVSAYLFRVVWPQGAVLYQFSVEDASGKISGIFTRPAPPASLTR